MPHYTQTVVFIREIRDQGYDLQIVQYLVLTEGTDYVLTLTALQDTFDDYIDIFETAVDTFESQADASSTAEAVVEEEVLEPAIYVNEGLGFEVTAPLGWELDESNPALLASFMSGPTSDDDAFSENINVLAVEANELPDAVEYGDMLLGSLTGDFAGGDLLLAEETEINGFPAIRVEYTYTLQDIAIHASQHVILAGDLAVIITCTALEDTFEAYREDFEGSINTFSTLVEE